MTDINKGLKNIVSAHLNAQALELKGLLRDIKENEMTTVHQIIGLINSNLDLVNKNIDEIEELTE